jgi:hypothetical protein
MGGSMKSTQVALAAAVLFFAASGWVQHGDHKMVSPGELKWNDVPTLPPGAKIAVIEGPMSEPVPFTVRLKFPANYQIPAHWHPAVERVTVLTGTINMGIGDKLDKQKTTPCLREASASCSRRPTTSSGPQARKSSSSSTARGLGASPTSILQTTRGKNEPLFDAVK